MKKTNESNLLTLVTIAMLSAVSFVLFLFEVPIFVSFGHLKLGFSDIPALLAGLAYGPFYGVAVELIKNLLELLVKGVGTQMGFGNLMNFIVGVAFVAPFSGIYRHFKSRGENKAIAVSSVISVISIVLIGFLANYLITPLFFKYFLGINLDSETLWAAIYSSAILNVIKGIMLSVVSIPLLKILLVRLKKFLK